MCCSFLARLPLRLTCVMSSGGGVLRAPDVHQHAYTVTHTHTHCTTSYMRGAAYNFRFHPNCHYIHSIFASIQFLHSFLHSTRFLHSFDVCLHSNPPGGFTDLEFCFHPIFTFIFTFNPPGGFSDLGRPGERRGVELAAAARWVSRELIRDSTVGLWL